jgi:hypothetical protein
MSDQPDSSSEFNPLIFLFASMIMISNVTVQLVMVFRRRNCAPLASFYATLIHSSGLGLIISCYVIKSDTTVWTIGICMCVFYLVVTLIPFDYCRHWSHFEGNHFVIRELAFGFANAEQLCYIIERNCALPPVAIASVDAGHMETTVMVREEIDPGYLTRITSNSANLAGVRDLEASCQRTYVERVYRWGGPVPQPPIAHAQSVQFSAVNSRHIPIRCTRFTTTEYVTTFRRSDALRYGSWEQLEPPVMLRDDVSVWHISFRVDFSLDPDARAALNRLRGQLRDIGLSHDVIAKVSEDVACPGFQTVACGTFRGKLPGCLPCCTSPLGVFGWGIASLIGLQSFYECFWTQAGQRFQMNMVKRISMTTRYALRYRQEGLVA